ncbi:DUF222 domain-containing protein [Herbihabitans rhizosphaerae]|uniref:DUF222 domain-containing protein n=1 Tax=Herbihabitans rhizosphaerae TaxID=1872711 RepID=UPI00102C07E7
MPVPRRHTLSAFDSPHSGGPFSVEYKYEGQQLIDELRAREIHIRQLEYERLQLVHEIHEQGIAKEMGAYSTASFLRDTVRISPADARRRVADANALFGSTTLTGQPIEAPLPVAARALASESISRDHVQVVRATIDKLPPEHHADVEQLLVDEAERFDPVKLATRTRAHLQPEQVVLEEQAARKRMEFESVGAGCSRVVWDRLVCRGHACGSQHCQHQAWGGGVFDSGGGGGIRGRLDIECGLSGAPRRSPGWRWVMVRGTPRCG